MRLISQRKFMEGHREGKLCNPSGCSLCQDSRCFNVVIEKYVSKISNWWTKHRTILTKRFARMGRNKFFEAVSKGFVNISAHHNFFLIRRYRVWTREDCLQFYMTWRQLLVPDAGTCVIIYTLILPFSVMRVMNLALGGRDANSSFFSFFPASLFDHLEAASDAATAALGGNSIEIV